MLYKPTAHHVVNIYIAATRHLMPPSLSEPLSPSQVKQTSVHTFRILAPTRCDENGGLLEDMAICLYDRLSRLWYVRLQNGVILRVAHDAPSDAPDDEQYDAPDSSCSVVGALPRLGHKMQRYTHEVASR